MTKGDGFEKVKENHKQHSNVKVQMSNECQMTQRSKKFPITNRSVIVWTLPPPLMGEGAGGRGQDTPPLGPPSPSSPPTAGRGDFLGLRLFYYGFLSK